MMKKRIAALVNQSGVIRIGDLFAEPGVQLRFCKKFRRDFQCLNRNGIPDDLQHPPDLNGDQIFERGYDCTDNSFMINKVVRQRIVIDDFRQITDSVCFAFPEEPGGTVTVACDKSIRPVFPQGIPDQFRCVPFLKVAVYIVEPVFSGKAPAFFDLVSVLPPGVE